MININLLPKRSSEIIEFEDVILLEAAQKADPSLTDENVRGAKLKATLVSDAQNYYYIAGSESAVDTVQRYTSRFTDDPIKLSDYDQVKEIVDSNITLFLRASFDHDVVHVYKCKGITKHSLYSYTTFSVKEFKEAVMGMNANCQHESKQYIGLFETFNYCVKCNVKL